MSTGSYVVNQLSNASSPVNGSGSNCFVSFGGSQVLQACSNFYIEVILRDPQNTSSVPASFSVQLTGGIQGVANPLGAPITAPGLYTITASSPVTYWQANLESLSGGVAPTISVNGVAGL